MECRLAYSREWAIRISHEQLMHERSSFLTLTYSDEYLPERGQLVKKDLQDFFKRLRFNTGPFRYVACGEYGERFFRPHFHVCLFGLDFSADRVFYSSRNGNDLFTSSELARSWKFGNSLIGSLTFESAAYVARYITKRQSGPGAVRRPLYVDDDGVITYANDPFLVMSRGRVKGQGIGGAWFDKYFSQDVFPHGRVITPQGTPAPIPRYYKERLSKMDAMILEARTRGNQAGVPFAVKRLEDSPGRRAARTIYAKARTSVFVRDPEE